LKEGSELSDDIFNQQEDVEKGIKIEFRDDGSNNEIIKRNNLSESL